MANRTLLADLFVSKDIPYFSSLLQIAAVIFFFQSGKLQVLAINVTSVDCNLHELLCHLRLTSPGFSHFHVHGPGGVCASSLLSASSLPSKSFSSIKDNTNWVVLLIAWKPEIVKWLSGVILPARYSDWFSLMTVCVSAASHRTLKVFSTPQFKASF